MMLPYDDKQFKFMYIVSFIFALIVVCLLASCSTFKHERSNINKSDTTIHNSQGSSRIDSNGTKTDKVYTKETYYLPGKDTIINNIIQSGKPQVIYIKESGQEKTEQVQVIRDTSWMDAFRQLSTLVASKETEKKTSFLSPGTIIAFAVLGLVLLIIIIVVVYLVKKINVINLLLTKN